MHPLDPRSFRTQKCHAERHVSAKKGSINSHVYAKKVMLVSNWENTLKEITKEKEWTSAISKGSKAHLTARIRELEEFNRKLRIKNLVLETKLVKLKDKEVALNVHVLVNIRQESCCRTLRS